MREPNETAVEMLETVAMKLPAWASEIRTQRNAIYSDCPRAFALDRGHALQRVAGVMLAGVGSVLAQRYLIRGLLADGFSAQDVAHALRATAHQMASAQGELPIWQEGVDKLRALQERTLPPAANARGFFETAETGERRQGDLTAGSRGWRTPPSAFPQTRDYRPSR